MGLPKRHDIGRAGKVKAMTPRVECCLGQELQRKKSRNGRAKKRRLYNKLINNDNKKSQDM